MCFSDAADAAGTDRPSRGGGVAKMATNELTRAERSRYALLFATQCAGIRLTPSERAELDDFENRDVPGLVERRDAEARSWAVMA